MPVTLAKDFLRLYKDDLLFCDDGFELTLEGSLILETEETLRIFSEDPMLSRSFRMLEDFIRME